MPKITWLGDVDHPESFDVDACCTWGGYVFPLDTPVEVDDPHIIAKARTNRFFRMQEQPEDAALNTPPVFGQPFDPFLDQSLDPVIEAHELAPPKRSHKKKVVQP